MKAWSCQLENFASYKELNFEFDEKGLILISGPTGSGKSTLCDATPWCLFGRTAKNGSVDEIINWTSGEPTKGTIFVTVPEGDFIITRIRGKKAKDNDLYFADRNFPGNVTRGKDLNDTQALINNLLGLTADLYLSGAYFHEFSQTAQFFTTTAKNRRAICEQVVDLSLAKTLQTNAKEATKTAKEVLSTIDNKLEIAKEKAISLSVTESHTIHKMLSWDTSQKTKIEILQTKYEHFEQMQDLLVKDLKAEEVKSAQIKLQHIEELIQEMNSLEEVIKPSAYFDQVITRLQGQTNSLCEACGKPKHDTDARLAEVRREKAASEKAKGQLLRLGIVLKTARQAKNPYTDQITAELLRVNSYADQIATARAESNPHKDTYNSIMEQSQILNDTIIALEFKREQLSIELVDLSLLAEAVDTFRSALVKTTINQIQEEANKLLDEHFDAEIRVNLTLEEADKLEASVQKDGNICSYTQLSKGQRQLLKLSFGVAVMKAVAHHNGVSFDQIWIDEAFDGLSEEFKIKAYRLLENLSLEYNSIFVVEHSAELKAMFPIVYNVQLVNGASQVTKQ